MQLTAVSDLWILQGQVNDASEVLEVIFGCLHQSCISGFGVSNTESSDSMWIGSCNCDSDACAAHKVFGMNVFVKMICSKCGIESRQMKYNSLFYDLNASALRKMKAYASALRKLEACFN